MPANHAPRVDAALRDARALELRNAGLSYRQIAAQMGVSVGAAYKYVTRGLDRTRREPADVQRQIEANRLDHLQVEATAVLRARHYVLHNGEVVRLDGRELVDHAPTLNAIRTLLAVQDRRAKLLGLDAPTKLDAKVSLTVAWERATEDEKLEILRLAGPDLFDKAIAELEAELARRDEEKEVDRLRAELADRGPPTPPAAETITSTPEQLAAAVEAALDAARVPPAQREAAYAAVEAQLLERGP